MNQRTHQMNHENDEWMCHRDGDDITHGHKQVNNKGTMAIMKLIMPVMASLAYPIATLKLLIAIMMMTI